MAMDRIRQRSEKLCDSNYSLLFLLLIGFCCVRIAVALECYACDSAEDQECATKPGQQIAAEECTSDTDECVQVVVAGYTRRGCLSRLFPNRYCPQPCERCTKSLCNRDIFPRDRLRCYQCTGANCVNVEKKTQLLLACPLYHENDRCFMNVLHASNVHRGCEHSLKDVNNCPNSCIKCNRSGCNLEPGVSEHSCLQCSHTRTGPDPECWRGQDAKVTMCAANPAKYCRNKNLYGQESKCFTYINEQTGVVNRGCSSNKPFYPTGNLTECYGENCNNECLPISCNICSSKNDANCRQGSKLRASKCSAGTQSCFSCEKGNHVTRGCADDDFFGSTHESEVCYLCRDIDGCNKFPARTCISCSSLENEDCALMAYPDTADRCNCSSHDDLCVTTVVSKLRLTYVLRDCASHLTECTNADPLCVRCNGSLCNNVSIDIPNTQLADSKNELAALPDQGVTYEVVPKSPAHRLTIQLFVSLVPLCISALLYYN